MTHGISYGFVYIWYDRLHRMFYIGSHYGDQDDGYVCSSRWMMSAFKKRPSDFSRRILEHIKIPDKRLLHEREQYWLDFISNSEIGSSENVSAGTARYYNHKKLARGGSAKGHTKTRTKPAWNVGVTKEMQELRRNGLFCLLIDRPSPKSPRMKIIEGKLCVIGSVYSQEKICPNCACKFHRPNNRQVCCSRSCSQIINTKRPRKKRNSIRPSGRKAWNKGKSNPFAAANGKNGAAKQSAAVMGRKKCLKEDGTWYWSHPSTLK